MIDLVQDAGLDREPRSLSVEGNDLTLLLIGQPRRCALPIRTTCRCLEAFLGSALRPLRVFPSEGQFPLSDLR